MLASAQLALLDGFTSPEQSWRAAQTAPRRMPERARPSVSSRPWRELAGGREREIDLLAYELGEIEDVAPDEVEERELLAARERLRHLDALRGAAFSGAPGDVARGGGRRCRGVARCRWRCARRRAGRRCRARRDRRALARAGIRGAGSRRRAAGLRRGARGEPGALEATEERLAAVERLERKHGGTIAGVLAHAERCPPGALSSPARRSRSSAGGRAQAARAEQAKAAGELRATRETPRRASRARCASAWPSWRWRARASRSRRGARAGPTGRRHGGVPHRAERGRRRGPCARPRPAASSRA